MVVFPAAVIVAAVRDATTFTIPNWLCAVAALAFFPVALACGLSPMGYLLALGLFVAALAAGMAMFAFGWIGGGDAKLFAVCGLWLGGAAIWPFLAWTAVAGGALALGLLFGRRMAQAVPLAQAPWLARLLTPGENVPYGVAIAVGALAAFPESPVMQALSRLG
jgi:prepilin peptidase CpaA